MDDGEKKAKLALWLEEAKDKGFKAGWAAYQFKDEFGEWPPKGWMPEPGPDELAARKARKVCWLALKAMQIRREYDAEWVFKQYKAAFSRDPNPDWEAEYEPSGGG